MSWVLKVCISLAIFAFVGMRLMEEKVDLTQSLSSLTTHAWGWIVLALGLLVANIGLEARKWQVIIRLLYPRLGFWQACQAVIAGISTGLFTPNRIGEYAGRLWSLPQGKRIEAGGLTLVSRLSQMAITLFAGTLSLEYLNLYYQAELLNILPISLVLWQVCRVLAFGLFLIFSLLLLQPRWWMIGLGWIPIRRKWYQKVRQALGSIPRHIVWKLLGLSLLRFCVFTTQYLCLLIAFGDQGEWQLAVALIALVFWINSVVPSITLTELGIRESIALVVMGGFGISTFAAFTSTFLLYWINLIGPGLLGVFVLYRLRSWNI